MIVSTAISDTQSAAYKHASSLMHRRRLEDWCEEKTRLLHDLAGRRTGKWMPTNAKRQDKAGSVSLSMDVISGNGNSSSNHNSSYSKNSILNPNPNPHPNPNPNPNPDTTFYTHGNASLSLDNAILNNGGLFSPPPKSSSASISFISPLNAMVNLNGTGGTPSHATPIVSSAEAWGGVSTLTESARRHAGLVARLNHSRATGESLSVSNSAAAAAASSKARNDAATIDPASNEFKNLAER